VSTYALVQRGVAHADSTVGGGVSPLDIALASPIKLGSAFVVARPKDIRRDAAVQRGSINLTSASVSPLDTVITSVDLTTSEVRMSYKQKRTNSNSGVTIKLLDATHVRVQFDTIAAGDTVDIEWEVAQRRSSRGGNLRILDANHVRMEWDGTLVAGESIDIAYDVFDLANFGDDIKELLFRVERLLAIGGENSLQDNQLYDQAGNPTTFRIRTFDTLAHCQAAVVGDTGGLATGELSRCTVTLTWPTGKNRPTAIQAVMTDLLATPGIG